MFRHLEPKRHVHLEKSVKPCWRLRQWLFFPERPVIYRRQEESIGGL